ncbi:Rpn family recombination-promoting nuclease/putative transposase [Anabaena sp. CS-542/02]|uniref:Rpn family recombination-promoting nuclease/putative transposase n=1 Tax=Anabaena sp. CS-542/02 TaxID=3021719 RepID=UPI00232C9F05|nr:Rpn family recombination-promoting nuclease/putative transposase [Anabaena sp. CS-542/02]MDB9447417.1 Rpn family recombination-promoting nuclease/putative transposase [Anabaena sp. CS-542/02]
MAKKADIGGKRLIGLAPNTWVKWITQRSDLQVQDILNTEFQWIERESDVLLKVLSPEIGEFLLLNELQLRYNQRMPRRLRAYTALAEERYNLRVYPVLINILPPSNKQSIPQRYESEILGITAHQDYQVINLWEVDVNLVFEQKISTLLPFVQILQGGSREDKLREAVRELRRDEQLQDLEPLLSFFASFVLDIPLVQQIMRWDMTVLRESPWYQEILKEGEKQGLQQGRIEGRQEGRQEGESQLVLRQLQRRLGTLDDTVKQQIQMLPVEQLESLAEELLDFRDIQQLQSWLERVC